MNEEVQMVPLTALESQAQRDHQTMRYLALGWCITLALAVFSMLCMASYEEEVVTETETIERYAEASYQGNAIVGDGDISIGDSTANGYEDEDYDNA